MNGGFLLYQATLGMLCVGLCSLGDDVDSFNDGTLLFDEHFQNSALFAALLSRVDLDIVAFLYM